MKIKSLALTSVSAVLLFSFSLTTPTFAQAANKDSYTIGKEALAFLQSHKVDVTPFKKSSVISDKIYSKQNPSVSLSKSSLYDEEVLSVFRN
ncbi:hypothetical protein CBW65_01940 [Tumebacillus avium]|uniref:SLH domain-containing protein n=1 Tax=Tumebacillus avium TaxID=1903704 RepID=A0A1Y0IHP0_9BACL|nr:hypothetical protein [Tumebacillus avium]ARU59957.1 hypothetical protein CBW65_01940 [Tumebacillus avium]